jgi:two-component system, chemotaxis family, protein-glutamate methylesterase/glutaminase
MYGSVHRGAISAGLGSTMVPRFEASAFDLVVIAGSAGSGPVLQKVVAQFPRQFPAPVAIAQHIGARRGSMLAQVLEGSSALPVHWGAQGERVRGGCIYLAPSDAHLVLGQDFEWKLDSGPKQHWTRPAADPLFISAARWCGARTLGVVLSGYGTDGSEGALAIWLAGGTLLLQDPQTCVASQMPARVQELGCSSLLLDPEVIGDAITTLVMLPGTVAHFRVHAA